MNNFEQKKVILENFKKEKKIFYEFLSSENGKFILPRDPDCQFQMGFGSFEKRDAKCNGCSRLNLLFRFTPKILEEPLEMVLDDHIKYVRLRLLDETVKQVEKRGKILLFHDSVSYEVLNTWIAEKIYPEIVVPIFTAQSCSQKSFLLSPFYDGFEKLKENEIEEAIFQIWKILQKMQENFLYLRDFYWQFIEDEKTIRMKLQLGTSFFFDSFRPSYLFVSPDVPEIVEKDGFLSLIKEGNLLLVPKKFSLLRNFYHSVNLLSSHFPDNKFLSDLKKKIGDENYYRSDFNFNPRME